MVAQVFVTFSKLKRVEYNDDTWQVDYDACRADKTYARTTTALHDITASHRPRNSQSLLPLTRARACVLAFQLLTRCTRMSRRSASLSMEWCLKRPEQVEVMGVEPLQCGGCD